MNNLVEYFAMSHISRSFSSDGRVYRNPHYNFRLHHLFLPSEFKKMSSIAQTLILSHEAAHAADFFEVFMFGSHFLNELIANFNYYCGSVEIDDVAHTASEYFSPPMYSIAQEQYQNLTVMVEGRPVLNRFVRFNQRASSEDKELWKLQKKYITDESPYGVGFLLYINLIDRMPIETAYEKGIQTLLNSILQETYYDVVLDELQLVHVKNQGYVIPFVRPPDYTKVVNTLSQLKKDDYVRLTSRDHIVAIREKILEIYQKLGCLIHMYEDALTNLEQKGGFVTGYGGLISLRKIFDFLTEAQSAYLRALKGSDRNDIVHLNYYLGISTPRFEEGTEKAEFYYYDKLKELKNGPHYQDISNDMKYQIALLDKCYDPGFFMYNCFASYCRPKILAKKLIVCPLREFMGDVEMSYVEGICRPEFLEVDAPSLEIDSCQYHLGDDFSKKAHCLFMKVLQQFCKKRSDLVQEMFEGGKSEE